MAFVVITGCNKGIGLELARQYAARGDEVVAVVRKASPELAELGVAMQENIDVTSDSDVARLAGALAGKRIDILVNNAGILLDRESLEGVDFDKMRAQFEINTLGPLRISKALANNLGDGSKVAIVSSRVGSIGENDTGGRYGYRTSKAAVNMVGVCLAHELRDKGIAVVMLHPGYVRTYLTGMAGHIEPDESATGLIARIDDLTLESSGQFQHVEGRQIAW